jgi:hypothetical protein
MGNPAGLFDKECGVNRSWFDPDLSNLGWWDPEIAAAAGGTVISADGAAVGAAAVSANGAAIWDSVGASVGSGVVTGVSGKTAGSVGASVGAATVQAISSSVFAGTARSFTGNYLDESYSEAFVDGYDRLNGDPGNTDSVGQAFVSNGGTLDRVQFFVKKHGSPTGNAVARLWLVSGTVGVNAKPTGSSIATSDPFDVSTLTTTAQLITLMFSGANRYLMTAGTSYAIALEYTGGDAVNHYVEPGFDQVFSGPPTLEHSGNWVFRNTTSGWEGDRFVDTAFYVYAVVTGPTATGIGAAVWDSVGNAAGSAAVSANSGATKGSVANAAGTGTALANSGAIAGSVGASSGVGIATGLANAIWDGVFNSTGLGTASANSSATWNSVGSAASVGVATGFGNAIWDGVGNASGTSTVSGDGAAITSATGSDFFAAGTSTVQAISSTIYTGTGQSDGAGSVNGVSGATAGSVGNAAGMSFVVGDGGTGGVVITPPPGGAMPYGIEGFYFKGKFYPNKKPPREKEKEKLVDRFADARRDDKELLEILAMIAPYL